MPETIVTDNKTQHEWQVYNYVIRRKEEKKKKILLTGVKDIQNSTDGLITKLLLMRRRKIISWRKRIKTATVLLSINQRSKPMDFVNFLFYVALTIA